MKRLIAIVLIICSLSVFAYAETDPAIGMWYYLLDNNLYPEFVSNFGDFNYMLIALAFLDNGTIIEFDSTVTDGSPSQECSLTGRWSKDGDTYKYSLFGIGEGTFTIDGDNLYMHITTEGVSFTMRYHRIITLNPYTDYTI